MNLLFFISLIIIVSYSNYHIFTVIRNVLPILSVKTLDPCMTRLSNIIVILNISNILRVVICFKGLSNKELYVKRGVNIAKPTVVHLTSSPLNTVGFVGVGNYNCLQ